MFGPSHSEHFGSSGAVPDDSLRLDIVPLADSGTGPVVASREAESRNPVGEGNLTSPSYPSVQALAVEIF